MRTIEPHTKLCTHCRAPYARGRTESLGRWAVRQFCTYRCHGAARNAAGSWPRSKPLSERVSYTVNDATGCWEWQKARDPDGYGRIGVNGKIRFAHRVVFELITGRQLVPGLSLDHLCRNPSCVNPAHLEEVSHRANMLRGATVGAANARKTHCLRGHPFDAENTVVSHRASGPTRVCRACRRLSNAAARKVAAARTSGAAVP